MLQDVVEILAIALPLLLTLAIGHMVRLDVERAPRIAAATVGTQVAMVLVAWILLGLLPREGNRSGGTCASFRRGELDEVVLALAWGSAIIGGVAFAGSIIASRQTSARARWRALAVSSVLLPYVVFASLYWTGLCYLLDT